MSVARSSRFKGCLAQRAEGYDIAWDKLEDRDLYELRARVWEGLERARRECRPTVIEIATYRFYGFHVADASSKKHRTPEEIEEKKRTRDPIDLWKRRLIEEQVLQQQDFDLMDGEAKAEALASTVFAADAAPPGIEDIVQHVYWESDNNTPASKIGRHFFD
jgi:pyruvate dehydrogenase E1 component alpha subunit